MRASLDRFDPNPVSATLERQGLRAPALAHACLRLLALAWLALLPIALVVFVVQSIRDGHGAWAIDFNGNFREPAAEILRGSSPYDAGQLERVRAAVEAGRTPIDFEHGVFAAYPAPSLLLGVPFTALPYALAAWLWFGLVLAAGGLALYLAGVRDRLVYLAALLAPPVIGSLYYGAIDLVLMLGLAACWRWRDHAPKAGLALGAMIALKLVALPLVLWLAATRRFAAAGIALAVAGALALAGWAAIGFDGLTGYPHLLSLLTEIESDRGYSAVAVAGALGLGAGAAAWAPSVVGACLLAALAVVARRGHGADASAFLLGVLAALAFSPILWQHSYALVLVPLAVLRPRFGPVWALPLLLWLAPDGPEPAEPFPLLVCMLVIAGLSAWALTGHSREVSATRPAESISLA